MWGLGAELWGLRCLAEEPDGFLEGQETEGPQREGRGWGDRMLLSEQVDLGLEELTGGTEGAQTDRQTESRRMFTNVLSGVGELFVFSFAQLLFWFVFN